jgi:RNA-directed DNA polymerase
MNPDEQAKALAREREALRQMTGLEQCHTPLPELTKTINRHLRGWGKYFSLGYPRKAYRQINSYVRQRLTYHLQRRSQRGYRPPAGTSFYEHLSRMGLISL